MNWEAIGAVGEIVGAIAVVATLFYLSREISDTAEQLDIQNRLLRAGIFDSIDVAFREFRAPIIASEEVAKIWDNAKNGYSDLEGIDRVRADELLFEYFVIYRNMYIRLQEVKWEIIDQFEVNDWYRNSMSAELSCPGTRDWWKQNSKRLELHSGFVDLVDTLVSEFEPSFGDT